MSPPQHLNEVLTRNTTRWIVDFALQTTDPSVLKDFKLVRTVFPSLFSLSTTEGRVFSGDLLVLAAGSDGFTLS